MALQVDESRVDDRNSQRLRKVISCIDDLPTLPVVVTRIMMAMEDPDTSANDIQKIVSTDQAITAKVLKVVNSSFYGFPRRIGSISEAVVILGFNTIRNLAITCSLFHCFRGRKWAGFDHRRFWSHSIGAAVLSRFMGKKILPMIDGEELFVMGLLHDIGKVLIEQHLPDGFSSVLIRIKKEDISFHEAEEAELGVTHGEVGSWLCLQWNLPVRLAEVVRHHHVPAMARENARPACLVHFADAFCHRKGYNHSGVEKSIPISKRAAEILQLSPDLLVGIDDLITEELERAKDFFDLYGN